MNTKYHLAFGWQYLSRCSVLTSGYGRKEEACPIDSVCVHLIDVLQAYNIQFTCLIGEEPGSIACVFVEIKIVIKRNGANRSHPHLSHTFSHIIQEPCGLNLND